jgi:hypothetical protein
MRAGITVSVTPEDRCRLVAIVGNRNSPRWTFPLHADLAGRLNAVEGFFSALTRRRLKRGVIRSIVDIQAAINRYVAQHNPDPKPFSRTADPQRVLAAVSRGNQALESLH